MSLKLNGYQWEGSFPVLNHHCNSFCNIGSDGLDTIFLTFQSHEGNSSGSQLWKESTLLKLLKAAVYKGECRLCKDGDPRQGEDAIRHDHGELKAKFLIAISILTALEK